jgi:hypothetical protein
MNPAPGATQEGSTYRKAGERIRFSESWDTSGLLVSRNEQFRRTSLQSIRHGRNHA